MTATSIDGKGDGKVHLKVLTNMSSAETRAKYREYVMPATFNYYSEPLVLRRGKGLYVEDAEGVSYLDFFGGILTIALSHCNPEIVAALTEQLQTLGHTSTRYR